MIVVSILLLPVCQSTMALSTKQLDALLMPQSAANDAVVDQMDKLFNQEKAMRPIVLFLQAERLRLTNKLDEAGTLYYELVKEAGKDQYNDTWGDNGLVAFALFRWLELEERFINKDKKQFIEISKLSDDLMQRRLVRSAFDHRYYILPRLPILEEKILHKLATLAHRMELPKLAAKYYLNYVSRSKHLISIEEDAALYKSIIEHAIASKDRISFLHIRGLSASGKLREMLREIIDNEGIETWEEFKKVLPQRLNITTQYEDAQLQLQVEYLLLRATRNMFDRRDIERLYRDIHQYASDDELASQALFWHSLLFKATECIIKGEITEDCGQSGGARPFGDGLKKLVDTYDDVSKKDDAFDWLAMGEIRNRDLDVAAAWYEKLAEFDADSKYSGRLAFRIAMEYIWRDTDQGRQKAYDILSAFSKSHHASRWALNALFWLGRLEEERGNSSAARMIFEKCISYDPYGYYGLRSRMHVFDGAAAKTQVLSNNTDIKKQIRKEYRTSIESVSSKMEDNPYLRRFLSAVNSGLFAAAVKGEERLRQINPSKRLEDYTPEELDDAGFFASIAVMFALRQDALAAADSIESTSARLVIAERAGEGPGDWPLSLTLSHRSAFKLQADRSKLTQTPGYIKVSHPAVYRRQMSKVTRDFDVSPSIIYSVMRNESFFYPAALSRAGALGLFQFTEKTFDRVNRQWNLLQKSGVESREAYLLNKERSFELAAQWFSDPESLIFDPNKLFMILGHHSGEHRVAAWKKVWDKQRWLNDVEMMIETFRMPGFVKENWVERHGYEARGFARNVIADMIIVDLLDIYQNQ